jgi:hypothetical protein
MHRYMQAPFCDAVVKGSVDVRKHQVCNTVFSNHKIVVMEKEACHQVPILKLRRCRRLASDFSIFQRKFNNFLNDTLCTGLSSVLFGLV